MLAYLEEPLLSECIEAILASEGVDVDVVLVDNGCTDDDVERMKSRVGVTVLKPEFNLGFAGGCNYGAEHAVGKTLVFINSDAVVSPHAIKHLVTAVEDDAVGMATSSLRLYRDPELMNSAGNPVHFSGLSWAGSLGESVNDHVVDRPVASASGAATAIRTTLFIELGGFYEKFFAYLEDTELSLRCWLRGYQVIYVADAIVFHHYEFSRNSSKNYLLERNRLLMILTIYHRRTLLMILPALMGLELAVILLALRQGWTSEKLQGWRYLWRHRNEIRSRRLLIQQSRQISDRTLARVITGDLNPGQESGIQVPAAARNLSRAYWEIVRRCLPA